MLAPVEEIIEQESRKPKKAGKNMWPNMVTGALDKLSVFQPDHTLFHGVYLYIYLSQRRKRQGGRHSRRLRDWLFRMAASSDIGYMRDVGCTVEIQHRHIYM
jgi:hypothetical protein